jgi:glycosyltransferase involved in cell wall biosynthesis
LTLDVSIVIPTYNQKPRYLSEAIESALNQSYPKEKYEILVVDDGSTRIPPDSVVLQFKYRDVILVKKKHGGTAETLNAGIRSMNGRYFKWLSSDDALCEDALEILMSEVNENSVVYGDWARIDQNSNFIDVYHEPTFPNVKEMKEYLWHSHFGNASAALIPRSAFAKVGMFDANLPCYEDYDWWLRAVFLHDYTFVHVDRVVARYRIHLGQLTMHDGKKPLCAWRIKKRVYFVRRASSSFDQVSNPSVSALINRMLFSEAADLYRRLFRHSSPLAFLKKAKNTLMAP